MHGGLVAALLASATGCAVQSWLPAGWAYVTLDLARAGVTARGTSGPDVIVGTDRDETIDGRGGNDLICSGGGDDAINGGAGDDRIDRLRRCERHLRSPR